MKNTTQTQYHHKNLLAKDTHLFKLKYPKSYFLNKRIYSKIKHRLYALYYRKLQK